MIVGFGIDLCDIRRIEEILEKHGKRFVERCFTEVERVKSDGRARARGVLCEAIRREGGVRQGAWGQG